ncbi:HD domain-containing protein [Lacticaseibacillus pantheris]|uniref:HD domain-containing protein n=1 Tax=Lacticaseibacillus pantheris TaxID=171523 RepID=UPI0026593974|nr:HD domain-containing protein [Lacticaseibacillus pantheris]WKF84546.1 HD domain-containing protein [Lacticaseibacillus pantheris]
MEKYRQWEDDQDYRALVDDLLAEPAVQKLANYTQHHHSNRLEHSIRVSYTSYLIGVKMGLNVRALARGGLLHDLFYYDWRTTKFDSGTHAYVHPRIALHNAEHLTELSPMERDIIVKHMWGATLAFPRYRESYIVSLVDDYAAMAEFMHPWRIKIFGQHFAS